MNESKTKKENMFQKIAKVFNGIPKIGKIIVLIAVLTVFLNIGSIISSNFSTHSKATKFGLKDMGELVTQTAHVTIIQDTREDRSFFNLFKIPFTESRMIFSYDFTVDASVNFERISYIISDEKKETTVKLPHAKHYKTTMIIDSQEVYLDDDGLFSRIDLKEQNKAMLEMEDKAKNTAMENNFLEAADKNAQKIISALLKSDPQRKEYKIVYEYIN